jgi:peptidoglycan hydrolase CwlO-like protein
MKVITGTQGTINELLRGIPNDEVVSLVSSSEGKISVLIKTNGVIGTPLPDDDREKYEQHCNELQKALDDCRHNAEAALKERDADLNELTSQLDVYIKENADLNKALDKKTKDVEKLKEDLAKVKSALKTLQ